MKRICITILFFTIFPILAFGQSIQVGSQNLYPLIQSLVGSGVTISNITVNGTPSHSYGFFTNGNPASVYKGLGINEGVILTTGKISDAVGSNVNSPEKTVENGTGGEPLLDNLGLGTTMDACVISFDIVPQGNSISLKYVFASEEYPNYVDDQYNDVMGIFISGPGIAGVQNISLVPGTSSPVCVNNVNEGYSTECDSNTGTGCMNCAYFENNCFGKVHQYDGFTKVLRATASNLTRCETYRMTIAIADVEDMLLDSALFIEKKSITSPVLIAPAKAMTDCVACESILSPTNLSCEKNQYGITNLTWAAVPGALYYVLEIIVNDTRCCGSSLPFALANTTTSTNSFSVSANYPCFTWRVKAICPGGKESPYSSTLCSTYCSRIGGPIGKLTLSPNPNNTGTLNMRFTTTKDVQFTVDIIDMSGNKAISFENNKTTDKKFEENLKLGNLKKGVYLVNVTTAEGETSQEKLIIE